jgi:hypothetical protein
VNNGAPIGVMLAGLRAPDGSTPISITSSSGVCSGFSGLDAVCLVGDIPTGGWVVFDLVARSTSTFTGLFTSSIDVITDTGASGSATAGPGVVPPVPGTTAGFVAPGGSISLGTDATPTNNTVATFSLPNTGPGAPIVLRTETDDVDTFCGGKPCSGKILFVSPFVGYDDPRQPARLTITWDRSVAGKGLESQLFVQKEPGGRIKRVFDCEPFHRTFLAVPSPCVRRKTKLCNGDIQFEVLLLSGDPRFARR